MARVNFCGVFETGRRERLRRRTMSLGVYGRAGRINKSNVARSQLDTLDRTSCIPRQTRQHRDHLSCGRLGTHRST